MQGKVTLISSPDFFENENDSVLFMNLSEEEQNIVSAWFSKLTKNLNVYVYSGENDLPWLFYANNHCKHKYINLDTTNIITQALAGYILGKSDVYYKTSFVETAKIYSFINHNRVVTVEQFLEANLNDYTK
jgi:hypothetical protein